MSYHVVDVMSAYIILVGDDLSSDIPFGTRVVTRMKGKTRVALEAQALLTQPDSGMYVLSRCPCNECLYHIRWRFIV